MWTAIVIALAAAALVWLRFVALDRSFSGVEIQSVVTYIRPGPTAAFSHYLPNDHMLFELLTWLSTSITGDHSEAAYRFWGVAPALAAVALMAWWLWWRLDPWAAVIFTVLAAASPRLLSLSVQAEGYGLTFLAAAGTLTTADWVLRTGRRRALVLLALSGIAGIWTQPAFAPAFIATCAVVACRRSRRRDVIIVLGLISAATLLFYLPVIGALVHSAGGHFGPRLAWYGLFTRPLTDLLDGNVHVLVPSTPATVAGLLAGIAVLAGTAAAWLRGERFVAALALVPALLSYAVVEIGRFNVGATFDAFLILPLLSLAAIALVECGFQLARVRGLAPVSIALAVGFGLFTMARADQEFSDTVTVPATDFREAAAIVETGRLKKIVTDVARPSALDYYLRTAAVTSLTPIRLEHFFCNQAGRFMYVEETPTAPRAGRAASPSASTTCLSRRGAFQVAIRQAPSTGVRLTVWILGQPPRPPAAAKAANTPAAP